MRKLLTEFIGTFFFVLVIGLTVLGGLDKFAPIAIGSALMIMVYAGGHVSGGHYNPAVTLAILIRRRIQFSDAIAYVVAQVLGAAAAALVTKYFIGSAMPQEAGLMADAGKALLGEFLGTFALAYVVLNVATSKGTENNSFYGLAIGFTVTVMAYALGSYSGGAFNPAIAIGISIMKLASWNVLWVYMAGCFGGGIVAALVFRFINKDDHKVPEIGEKV